MPICAKSDNTIPVYKSNMPISQIISSPDISSFLRYPAKRISSPSQTPTSMVSFHDKIPSKAARLITMTPVIRIPSPNSEIFFLPVFFITVFQKKFPDQTFHHAYRKQNQIIIFQSPAYDCRKRCIGIDHTDGQDQNSTRKTLLL